MNTVHSTYETMRQFADSWGLLGTMLLFLFLIAWPFRPGARDRNTAAKHMIFAEDAQGNETHGE